MSQADSILFFISDNDLTKVEALNIMKRQKILMVYYEIRKAKLNELLSANASIKNSKKEN